MESDSIEQFCKDLTTEYGKLGSLTKLGEYPLIRAKCTGTDETIHPGRYCCNCSCEDYGEFMTPINRLFMKTYCPMKCLSVELVPVDNHELDMVLLENGIVIDNGVVLVQEGV